MLQCQFQLQATFDVNDKSNEHSVHTGQCTRHCLVLLPWSGEGVAYCEVCDMSLNGPQQLADHKFGKPWWTTPCVHLAIVVVLHGGSSAKGI